MSKQQKEKWTYLGLQIDSEEELAILYWLEELKDAGYIRTIERAKSFSLSPALEQHYTKEVVMKTKTKVIEKKTTLLKEHIYTPEFDILFTVKGTNLFLKDINSTEQQESKFLVSHNVYRAFIEVKADFSQNNMERLFVVNQKWMFDKYRLFINLLKPKELFKKTFTPKKWLVTPKTKKLKKLDWELNTLSDYIKTLETK